MTKRRNYNSSHCALRWGPTVQTKMSSATVGIYCTMKAATH